jgi:type I restriction enzyme S subunit
MLPGKRMVKSDCEWFPLIPEGWEIIRAKWLFDNVNSRGHSNEPLLSVTQEYGILPRDELEINVWNPKEDVSGYKLVEPGDFVISLRSFQGGIEYSNIRGIVSPAYTVLRPVKPVLNPYYRWFLKSQAVIEGLKALSTGIRQGKTIQYTDFCDLPCLVPPRNEAISIAKLLDQKSQIIGELKMQMRKLYDNHNDLVSSAVIGKVDFSKEAN